MLHEFLQTHKKELIERCRVKVAARRAPRPTEAELEHGIPLFLLQLINQLKHHLPTTDTPMLSTATQHGFELLRRGFTVAQVIHDYGDLCQAITELAGEYDLPISAHEFGALNRCLDDAIAAAVTEYEGQRERSSKVEGTDNAEMQLALVAHELRNLIHTARLSFEVIKSGSVAIDGATSALHDRTLSGLGAMVDGILADTRLSVGVRKEPIELFRLIEDVEIAAMLEAKAQGIRFSVTPMDDDLSVNVDRPILEAVLTNLLQNAFKFTRVNRRDEVLLRVTEGADRVLIEIIDQCGGLPPGDPEDLFLPFQQRGLDRRGLGLGLTICKRGVEANDGSLQVRDLPGDGCVFTVDLPRTQALAS